MPNTYYEKNIALFEKLKKARLESGLTQIEVSKKLKKPQSHVSKLESGERKLVAVELIELAKIYKKDLNYFLN
jgi:transcriptional regulator with XRE-family HTH domain